MTNNPLVEALREIVRRYVEMCDVHPAHQAWLNAEVSALASSAPATGEREQIVAWLRMQPKLVHASPAHMLGNTPQRLADQIERGDHRTQSGEMEGGDA